VTFQILKCEVGDARGPSLPLSHYYDQKFATSKARKYYYQANLPGPLLEIIGILIHNVNVSQSHSFALKQKEIGIEFQIYDF
jgi:hypothetical protein